MNKKVAVIAANGKVGKLVVAEAVKRGFDVTAFGRHENNTVAPHFVKKDLFDLTQADLQDFDVVVDAFGVWDPAQLQLHTTSLMHLADLLSGTQTRLLVVGGAGSLFINPEHTLRVMDAPDFPDSYKPVASAMSESLEKLRTRNDVKWTYLSPAADFVSDGELTGEYLLAGEEFTTNDAGESMISYADYAVAMVDEIEKGNHVQARISVIGA